MIELVCCDMAGTTVSDGGLVLESFQRTLTSLNLDDDEAAHAQKFVIKTMGQSKIQVFRTLFADRAAEANSLFEAHFIDTVHERGVREVPGAFDAFVELQNAGVVVALTTGFSPATRELLVERLGWADVVAVRVSPGDTDTGRGRPDPDMLWLCAKRARVTSMSHVVVVGDTASDMEAGLRAGAGRRIGVLTGTDDYDRLLHHGADVVLDSVSQLFGAVVTPGSF